jgi:hypothetical protein
MWHSLAFYSRLTILVSEETMRIICRAALALIVLLLLNPVSFAQRPKWTNPCATASSTDKQNLCTFLVGSYEQIDDRCGFSFGSAWYNPITWFQTRHPWDVIPKSVLQAMPLDSGDILHSHWTLLKLPALARLMTYGFTTNRVADSYALDVQDLSKGLLPLSFNPVLAPEVMLDTGRSNYVQNLTCANALKASENGKVNFAVGSAAEKFSSVENSSSATKLVYGTFESPIAYERRLYPDTFYFETLAWFENFQRSMGSQPPDSLQYVQNLEGVIVYDTVKGSMSTDMTGSASASYSVPLGSLEGEVDGGKSLGDTTVANLFYALIRDSVKVSTLPTVSELQDWFAIAGKSLVNRDHPLSKVAAWNSKYNQVEASFVVEGMPSDLCKAGLWQIRDADVLGLSLSAPSYHSAASQTTVSEKASGRAARRSACVWSLESTKADGTNPITGSLGFSDTHFSVELPFSLPYTVSSPKLQFISEDTPSGDTTNVMTAGFWYQVISPDRLDSTQPLTVDPKSTLLCDATAIASSAISTVTPAAFYPTGIGKASIEGRYLHVRYQWGATKAPHECTLTGHLNLFTKSGAPATVEIK